MAKIQWPINPEIGDQIPAPYGGAWVWDGCIWEHTCCPAIIITKKLEDPGLVS